MGSFTFEIILCPAMLIVSIIVGSNKSISVLKLESSNMSYNFLFDYSYRDRSSNYERLLLADFQQNYSNRN
jgi:hypothetical protein